MKKTKINQLLLIAILLFVLISRFFRLSFPSDYIFDEVYHAFTANAYAQNDPQGYEWWHTSPVKGTAYEWLHPPLAKLFMALGILLFGNNSFGWRFFSALFGVLVVFLTYLVTKKIFKEKKIALIAVFLAACENMLLTMSRVAMNDILLTIFILLTAYFLYSWLEKERSIFLISSFVFTGLAMGTKWTGLYLWPIIFIVLLIKFIEKIKKKRKKEKKGFIILFFKFLIPKLSLFLIPLIIYFLSYSQWWLQNHSWQQFKELHQQIWWYQTNLKATHDYQSPAWTWPLLIRPVWFWVDYQQSKIANIYNIGNPLIWWFGFLIVPLVIYQALEKIKTKERISLFFLIFNYFIFWLPWLFSPRILFLHHYLPAIPFLCILIAYLLNKIYKLNFKIKSLKIKGKSLVVGYLFLVILTFFFFYPINIGIPISKNLLKYFFWLPTWK